MTAEPKQRGRPKKSDKAAASTSASDDAASASAAPKPTSIAAALAAGVRELPKDGDEFEETQIEQTQVETQVDDDTQMESASVTPAVEKSRPSLTANASTDTEVSHADELV